MKSIINSLEERIVANPEYPVLSSKLFCHYINWLTGNPEDLDRREIKALIGCSQIFCKSDKEASINEGKTLLALLMDTCAKSTPDLIPIANSLYTHSGDFPNLTLLNKLHPSVDYEYNPTSQAQLQMREYMNTVEELDFTLTDFQHKLWTYLMDDKDIITTAPTSAGKTHIILNYLLTKIANSPGAFAAVIVPTRALISEVSTNIYNLVKSSFSDSKIEVCSIPVRERSYKKRTIFVMTQERLHEVLLRGDVSFNYLFIDEAQNISNTSRGVLLHITIEKVLENSNPQIIVSMPSASYLNSFSSIFRDISLIKQQTTRSPVSKILISVNLKGLNIHLKRNGSLNETIIPKGFKGKSLADIVLRLGKNHSNIIYRNRTDYCENIANKISENLEHNNDVKELNEAADYVEQFIHKDFTLAENLRKGVAFHYGPLPSAVRKMVEELVKSNHIKYIACTSTLAEGVNLPAKNLFLKNPMRQAIGPPQRLENVQINNITGRAGRMLSHFSGNVFLIEPEEWTFDDYFDDAKETDQIATYYNSINKDLELIIQALDGEINTDNNDQYRTYSIANKLLKEYAEDRISLTLDSPEVTLTDHNKKMLLGSVKKAHENLNISAFTLEENPTIGYIQQDKLNDFITNLDNLSEWILPHPRSSQLYPTLLKVSEQLHKFSIYNLNGNYSLNFVCSIASKWVKGISLKEIITDQITNDKIYNEKYGKKPPSVNSSVRNVMKVIDSDIRFRLANALKCYETLLSSKLIKVDIARPSVQLHSFLEIGASEPRMISLINLGLSREAAREVHEKIPTSEELLTLKNLAALVKSDKFGVLHAVTQREVKNLLN